ncbi:hypothetical protein GOV12_01440 [Candidatus Pacearchaeota archaeon]|nr:hypothetical protein [Candidatus Pacearchaeota archaeon]
MVVIKINNIKREVYVDEPTDVLPGTYNVDANYSGEFEKLDTAKLLGILQKRGLEPSGYTIDVQCGFNDRKVLGDRLTDEKKADGLSTVWIGLDGRIVNLEIVPDAAKLIEDGAHLEYAKGILEVVVGYVEDPGNYRE